MLINESTNNSELATQLRVHLKNHGINQVSVARAIGLSGAVISAYLSDKYKGDVPALEVKIQEWLSLQQERALANPDAPPAIIETKTYREIHALLRIVERSCELGLITGRSGVGKTTALQDYRRRHPSTILVEADNGYTARALFVELCEALSLDTRGSLHDLLGRVVAKLHGSGRMIIIDEAEHLPYRALEQIRRVYDKAGVGVALVGMPRLKTNLQGNPSHFEQLYSRIGAHRKVDDLNDTDIDALIASRLGPVDTDTLAALRQACKRNARILVKLARWCAELVRINGVALDASVVRQAADLVVIA